MILQYQHLALNPWNIIWSSNTLMIILRLIGSDFVHLSRHITLHSPQRLPFALTTIRVAMLQSHQIFWHCSGKQILTTQPDILTLQPDWEYMRQATRQFRWKYPQWPPDAGTLRRVVVRLRGAWWSSRSPAGLEPEGISSRRQWSQFAQWTVDLTSKWAFLYMLKGYGKCWRMT